MTSVKENSRCAGTVSKNLSAKKELHRMKRFSTQPVIAALIGFALTVVSTLCQPSAAQAQNAEPKPLILITNANLFDGSDKLATGMSVLIEDNKIAKIAKSIESPEGAKVIDAQGRTMTPGLIDCHVHLMWNLSPAGLFDAMPDYLGARTLAECEATLMRGYTSVRDVSGQVLGAKRAIDEGYFVGPRIWSSGAGISMTSGHGDLRTLNTLPRSMGGSPETEVERIGMSIFADGVPEVLTASRMQLRKGSHFLKMYVSGAVSGLRDPLDISEFSFEEVEAAADEAKRWNTYLAVHTYTDASTQQALQAGAMSIEHGNLMSEETMKLLAEKGAFLSTQVGIFTTDPPADWNADQRAKQQAAKEGLEKMFVLAKRYKVKIALGTDLVGTPKEKAVQAKELSSRLFWFTPAEILTQATANNAELLSWSGPRNPYPGKLGVIEEGAYADLLLVDGNPLDNLKLFDEPEKNLALIMKDGKIYKNNVQ
jgi:imidazolonepropionase-like amidohydrolase